MADMTKATEWVVRRRSPPPTEEGGFAPLWKLDRQLTGSTPVPGWACFVERTAKPISSPAVMSPGDLLRKRGDADRRLPQHRIRQHRFRFQRRSLSARG